MAVDHQAELVMLEESLWRESTRFDRDYMDGLLAPEFFEFGRSGRIWSREDILTAPYSRIDAEIPLPNFAVKMVGSDVALLTYRSEVAGSGDEVELGNRSSLWHRMHDRWKLVFHQGTPTHPDEEDEL